MKNSNELKPNFAPVYAAALYPELSKLFQKHGYALAIHGSLARDLDLSAIAWAENISTIDEVLEKITKTFSIHVIGEPEIKHHKRIAYTLSIGFGECAIDLSFINNS